MIRRTDPMILKVTALITNSPPTKPKSDAEGAGLKLVKEFLLYLWFSNVIDLRIVLR